MLGVTIIDNILSSKQEVRQLADTGFVLIQNFVKLGLYLKK